MSRRNDNAVFMPNDFVRFYKMDWDWVDAAWNANATVTNPIWDPSTASYITEQLAWGASTSFTYSSATYTNSYLIKNGVVIKNSSEVSATALSWVSWNNYQWLLLYNRTLGSTEEEAITKYAQRKLWPKNLLQYSELLEWAVGYWDMQLWAINLIDGVAPTINWATQTTDHLWRANHAYSYDGTNDRIETALTIPSVTNWTIWVWVYDSSVTDSWTRDVLADSWGWYCIINTNNWALNNWKTEFNFFDTWWKKVTEITAHNKNQWYFYTATWNWTQIELFKDWVSQWTTAAGNLWNNANAIDFWMNASTAFFQWRIWACVIYNRTLSSDEISQLYTLTSEKYIYKFPKYSTPNLEEGKVLHIDGTNNWTTYYDQSGNGNNWTGTSVTTTQLGLNKVNDFTASSATDASASNIAHSAQIIPTWAKTIAFTIDADTDRLQQILWNMRITAVDNWTLMYFNSWRTISFLIASSGVVRFQVDTTTALTLNKKYRILATWDWTTWANSAKIYINWIEDASDTPSATTELSSTYNLYIWRQPAASGSNWYWFDWQLIDIEIYNKNFSANEALQDYYSNFIPN